MKLWHWIIYCFCIAEFCLPFFHSFCIYLHTYSLQYLLSIVVYTLFLSRLSGLVSPSAVMSSVAIRPTFNVAIPGGLAEPVVMNVNMSKSGLDGFVLGHGADDLSVITVGTCKPSLTRCHAGSMDLDGVVLSHFTSLGDREQEEAENEDFPPQISVLRGLGKSI